VLVACVLCCGRATTRAAELAAEPFVLEAGAEPIEFVPIPAGEFLMGSPAGEPFGEKDEIPRRVRISTPFLLGRTELTVAQFAALDDGPLTAEIVGRNGDAAPTVPLVNISWLDLERLLPIWNERFAEQLPADTCIRIPTEAEWEYACRAGTTTPFFYGADPALADGFVWSSDNAKGRQPVGRLKPNPLGLHDMLGNVYEWTADLAGPYQPAGPEPLVDPLGPEVGIARAIRGGAFSEPAAKCRAANRVGNGYLGKWRRHMGVRLAIGRQLTVFVPPPPPPAPPKPKIAVPTDPFAEGDGLPPLD
jgi:formylglycine-generating enzyme required for sulfatase activity